MEKFVFQQLYASIHAGVLRDYRVMEAYMG